MQKYEYKCLSVAAEYNQNDVIDNKQTAQMLQEVLNAQAAEGWRTISVVLSPTSFSTEAFDAVTYSYHKGDYLVTLERPL